MKGPNEQALLVDKYQEALNRLIICLDPPMPSPDEDADAYYRHEEEEAKALIKTNQTLLRFHSPVPQDHSITPLIAAVMRPHHCCSLELFRILLAPPTNVNDAEQHGLTALHYLALFDRFRHIEEMLKKEDIKVEVNAKTPQNITPVYCAAKNGAFNALYHLITLGKADVNILNHKKQSPLHLACFFGQKEGGKRDKLIDPTRAAQFEACIYALLAAGAKVDEVDSFGSTPAMYLASSDIPDVIFDRVLEKLEEHGTRKDKVATNRNNLLAMARAYGLHQNSSKLAEGIVPSLGQLASAAIDGMGEEDLAKLPKDKAALLRKIKAGESYFIPAEIMEKLEKLRLGTGKSPNPSK